MSVYFLADGRGHVKIGYTANDPDLRVDTLQTGSMNRLRIIRVVDGGQKTEAWLHRKFAEYRIRGEWFQLTESMLTVVAPDEIPPPEKPPIAVRRPDYENAMKNLDDLQRRIKQL